MTERQGPRAGPGNRDTALAERFVSLADTLVDDFDLVELLDKLVQSCVELLDVSAAGLLLVDSGGSLHPIASSTETTRLLELFQLQNDEGPCLDCVRSGEPVSVEDISQAHERWPRFVPAAVASGFRTVHALPMRLRRETIGSLNLFVADGPPLGGADQRVAQALADVATIGILQQRSLHRASILAEQLQGALNTRIVIEQAKGVLAEFGGVGMDESFAALRRHARTGNLKLSDVAQRVVTSELPPGEVIPQRRT